jgi:8-oxo-dGTP pyrophosphatase MutT (NUDIX family)
MCVIVYSTEEIIHKIGSYCPDELGSRPGLNAPLALHRGDHSLNPGYRPSQEKLTEAAIVVPLIERQNGLAVLLTERSLHLKNHPGQVGFPGGRREPEDQSSHETALRELEEEISIPKEQVVIINNLDAYITRTGFHVTPVVAKLDPAIKPVPDPAEVEEIFEVPLAFLLDPNNRRIESRVYEGQERFFYAYHFDGHYIWGATAGMIINLVEVIDGPVKPPERLTQKP